MTQTRRSAMDVLDERADAGIYLATLAACLASALMLFAPDDLADGFMALAWSCMAVSAVCLALKLAIRLLIGPARMDGAGIDATGRLDA
jgi:hypothetical protein